jgi:hypothetical protein
MVAARSANRGNARMMTMMYRVRILMGICAATCRWFTLVGPSSD